MLICIGYILLINFFEGGGMVSKCISLSLGCSARIIFPSLAVYVRCSIFHILSFVRCLQNIYNVLHHVWTLEVRLAVRHLDRSPPPQHEPPFWFLLSCSSWARGLGVFLWWILFKKKKKIKPSLAAFEVQIRWRLLDFIFKLALFSWFYWFFFHHSQFSSKFLWLRRLSRGRQGGGHDGFLRCIVVKTPQVIQACLVAKLVFILYGEKKT